MDLYLISECRVYIGMQSGIFDVAQLFKRPMILTNMANWMFPFLPNSTDLGTFKHVYSKSRGRFLSVREWMNEPFHATSLRELGDDYVMHENDAAELSALVREFFERAGNTAPTPLQQAFRELRIQRGREILSHPVRPQDGIRDQRQRYRLASRLESATGLPSDTFLRQNWDVDAREAQRH